MAAVVIEPRPASKTDRLVFILSSQFVGIRNLDSVGDKMLQKREVSA
jgi:hypothetical protein